jgi:hypothetical protein
LKKLAIAVALWGSLICSPVHAKTFVGVLWPMFGPLPAVGLMELVAELKMMPDVEVVTYLHQSWPALVEDIDRQPPGTHTVVVGYSLGANSSVFVANKAKYVDLIIALQPSMLSWNPPVRGNVGRMIEIYNPNPWMTFGGMGSKKLVGDNIEYIANSDSHPGAQFNSQFRELVKSEIAKFTAEDRVETAQAAVPHPLTAAAQDQLAELSAAAAAQPVRPQSDPTEGGRRRIAQSEMPQSPKPAEPDHSAQERPKMAAKDRSGEWVAFLDTLSSTVNSGDLPIKRALTRAAMMDYAKRTYGASRAAGNFNGPSPPTAGDDIIAASFSSSRSL